VLVPIISREIFGEKSAALVLSLEQANPTQETQEHAMSIYHLWHVPAGDRDTKHPGGERIPLGAHQVSLAHGENWGIQEMFFFDNEEDAKWFCTEGYRGLQFQDDEGVTENVRDPRYIYVDPEDVDPQQDEEDAESAAIRSHLAYCEFCHEAYDLFCDGYWTAGIEPD
jgi:hypothetical protein